jgi:hypothetical protein
MELVMDSKNTGISSIVWILALLIAVGIVSIGLGGFYAGKSTVPATLSGDSINWTIVDGGISMSSNATLSDKNILVVGSNYGFRFGTGVHDSVIRNTYSRSLNSPVTDMIGAEICVSNGGHFPILSGIKLSDCLLKSEQDHLYFDASGAIFDNCMFDGPIPVNAVAEDGCGYTERSKEDGNG